MTLNAKPFLKNLKSTLTANNSLEPTPSSRYFHKEKISRIQSYSKLSKNMTSR